MDIDLKDIQVGNEPKIPANATLLERRRIEAGVSYRWLEKQMQKVLGDSTPTYETIRTYHLGIVGTDRQQPLILWALALIYNIELVELAPAAAETMERVVTLANKRAEVEVPSSGSSQSPISRQ